MARCNRRLVEDIVLGTYIDAVIEARHTLVDEVDRELFVASRAKFAELVCIGAFPVVYGVVRRRAVAVERLRRANHLGRSDECRRCSGT